MAPNDNTSLQDFEHKVALLVSEYAVSLSPKEMADALESIVAQLEHPADAPKQARESSPDPSTLLHSVDLRAGRGVLDWQIDFEETSFDEVLVALADRTGWGILELDGAEVKVQLLLSDAKLYDVEFSPTKARRSLRAYLQHKGLISDAQAVLLSGDAHARSVSESQVLLSNPHILPRSQAASAVLSYVALVAGRLETDQFGEGRYYELNSPYRGQTLVGVALHRLIYMRAKYRAQCAPEATKKRLSIGDLRRVDFPKFGPKRLKLSLSERQLLDYLLDRPRSLNHLLRSSPLSAEKTLAVLAGFEAVGLLVRAPESVNDTAGWARRTLLSEDKISAIHDLTTGCEDPFVVLGLHWSCYDAEVERRYKYLRELVSGTNLPRGIAPSHIKQVREIRRRMAEAYERLRGPEGRRTCREAFAPASKRKAVLTMLEKLANGAMRAKKFASALDFYQRLLELAPNHEHAARMLPSLLTKASRR